jgi:putative Holliday junction resolvase
LRILGVDYGDKRTGLAVSDPFGWTAQGIETVTGNMETAIGRICELAGQYGAEAIVVGYPRKMDGTIGSRAEKTDLFAAKLEQRSNVRTIKWDERLTSVYAERTMREAGKSASKNRAAVDMLAAVIILQSYLDSALASAEKSASAGAGADAEAGTRKGAGAEAEAGKAAGAGADAGKDGGANAGADAEAGTRKDAGAGAGAEAGKGADANAGAGKGADAEAGKGAGAENG